MTVAVAVFQGSPTPGMWLAADTLAICGGIKHHVHKIREFAEGSLAVVTSGYMLGKDIGAEAVEALLPSPISMNDFVGTLRTFYGEHGWKPDDDGSGPAWWDQSFLVTDGSSLWHVACDLHPLQYEKYWAIGNGAEVALGSLYTSTVWLRPRDCGPEAVRAACEYAQHCGGEVDSVFVPKGKTVLIP